MDAQQFLKEFGHIANAPGGVQRLREMVYNLAITGDLTSQLSEDGNASDLLANVDKKKNSLIKNKEFKRTPKFEKIPLQIPESIDIPNNWVWSQLVSIGEISPKNIADDDNLVSFIPMSGISQLHSGELEPEVKHWGDIKKGFTHFADGDVAIAKITPCFENRKSAIIKGLTNGLGAGTTELHVVRPIKNFIEPAYIYIFLRSPCFMVEGEVNMTGTAGQKRLPAEYFATRAFPLPPLEEQKRIIAKVDELMLLCDKLEVQQQSRNKLKNLTRTTLLDVLANAQSPYELKTAWQRVQEALAFLYTDPEDIWLIKQTIIDLAMSGYLIENSEKSKNTGSALLDDIEQSRLAWETESKDQELKEAQTMRKKLKKQKYNIPKRLLPKNWAWGSFLQISQTVVDCHNKTAPYVLKGIHLIRTTDIRNGKMDLRNTKKITEETYEYWARRMPPKEGDIFFTREAPMGEAAIVPSGDKVCLGQRTLLIKLFPEYFDNEFLLYAIYSPSFIARMEGLGVGATVKHLRVGGVEDLIVPVPPIDEQRIIVKKLKQLLRVCDALEKKLVMERRVSKILAQASIATLTETGQSRKDKLQNMEVA